MQNEDKIIEKYKKFSYNFFWNNSVLLGTLCFFFGLTPFYELADGMICDKYKVVFGLICLVTAILSYFLYNIKRKKLQISPLRKSNHFVGIYNIDELNRNKDYYDGVLISRISEVEYLKEILTEIYNERIAKKSICIIGESGSGKSTIINYLENNLLDIDVINCTDRYKDLSRYLEKKFNIEILDEIKTKIENSNRKKLFIFDQFERFFYLSYEKQKELKEIIFNRLNLKNVAKIFILRSDYFADYIYNYNKAGTPILTKGIFASLFNDEMQFDSYLLYCKNIEDEDFPQNNGEYQNNILSNRKVQIKELCVEAFDEMGENVFERFKDKKLIEKQIFLNLLENKSVSTNFEEFFYNNTDRELLNIYYDKQLCSTGDYYTSAKVMYLLSSGRINNILFNVQQIYNALLLSRDGEIQHINDILKTLCEIQLIKTVQRDNTNYYEIVHDYIAESFMEYAGVNLHQYIRSTLDDYRINFKNDKYIQTVKSSLKLKKSKKIFEKTILLTVVIVMAINSVYQMVYLKSSFDFLIDIPLFFASYYGYCLYTNVYKLYCNKYKWVLPLLFIGMGISVIASCIIYKYWIVFAGIGTVLIGLSFLVIRNSDGISRVAKKFYNDFFGKVTATGAVISIVGLIFVYTDTNFYIGFILILAELVYAFIAQLSEEYYYYCIGLMNSK